MTLKQNIIIKYLENIQKISNKNLNQSILVNLNREISLLNNLEMNKAIENRILNYLVNQINIINH